MLTAITIACWIYVAECASNTGQSVPFGLFLLNFIIAISQDILLIIRLLMGNKNV